MDVKGIKELKNNYGFRVKNVNNIFIHELLDDYTNFLLDKGYCDSDVYSEEPKAVDSYIALDK